MRLVRNNKVHATGGGVVQDHSYQRAGGVVGGGAAPIDEGGSRVPCEQLVDGSGRKRTMEKVPVWIERMGAHHTQQPY